MRVGASVPKQFLEVRGQPIILWSFEAIQRAGISEVIVVVPEHRISQARSLLPAASQVIAGGPSRQESVRLGLMHVASEKVVVHDAARPFAPAAVFAAVIAGLERHDGAVPGLQMQETVKKVRGGRVVETLEREEVWNIQTPQAFRTEVLRTAHARAATEGFAGTDDAQLLEHYGSEVIVVDGSPDAFKVTRPDDLERAEALVQGLSQ